MGNLAEQIARRWGMAAMVVERNWRQVLISVGNGLFFGRAQSTALVMAQSTNCEASVDAFVVAWPRLLQRVVK